MTLIADAYSSSVRPVLQGVLGAGIEDLARVKSIGPRLAEAIYQRLHPDG